MKKLSAYKDRAFRTYGFGPGVMIYDEMKQSITYRSLHPVEKLVLHEMIRCYRGASHLDTEDLSRTGFVFTYAHCKEDVDEKAFRKARKRICDLGFFSLALHLKELKPGAPHKYLPSTAWKTYRNAEVEKVLEQKARRKESVLREKAQRRVAFRQGLKTKRVGRQAPDNTGRETPDTNAGKVDHTGRQAPDATPKTSHSHRARSPRL